MLIRFTVFVWSFLCSIILATTTIESRYKISGWLATALSVLLLILTGFMVADGIAKAWEVARPDREVKPRANVETGSS